MLSGDPSRVCGFVVDIINCHPEAGSVVVMLVLLLLCLCCGEVGGGLEHQTFWVAGAIKRDALVSCRLVSSLAKVAALACPG